MLLVYIVLIKPLIYSVDLIRAESLVKLCMRELKSNFCTGLMMRGLVYRVRGWSVLG